MTNHKRHTKSPPEFGPDDVTLVIITAYLRGLASIVRLMRDRKNKQTQHIYDIVKRTWDKDKDQWTQSKKLGKPDFRPIFMAERNVRKYFLRFLFERSVKYGNEESRRIYNWHEDSTEKENILFNIAGSLLREIATKLYPFPLPSRFYKKYWARYEDPRFGRVYLSHPGLPELDFIDMIRGHCYMLCVYLFQYNVPISDSKAYLSRLIHDLLPYLDWVYDSGRQGVNSKDSSSKFLDRKYSRMRDMDKVLQTVVDDIKISYDLPYSKSRITQKIDWSSQTFNSMKEDTQTLDKFTLEYKEFIEYHKIDSEFLGKKDVFENFFNLRAYYDFRQLVAKRRKSIGSKCHEFIAYGLPQPTSLQEIITHGDKYTQDYSGYLLVAEQYLTDISINGKADYIVFKKVKYNDNGFWRPIAIFDLKTKTAFDFDFYGSQSRSKDKNRVNLDFKLSRRKLTEEEWEYANFTTLTSKNCNQLSSYAKILNSKFQQITNVSDDFIPIQVIILTDTSQDWETIRIQLHDQIYASIQQIQDSIPGEVEELLSQNRPTYRFDKKGGLDKIKDETIFVHSLDGSDLRITIIFLPANSKSEPQVDLLLKHPSTHQLLTGASVQLQPKSHSSKDIILYHPVSSAISAGKTIAWMTSLHHLIPLVQSNSTQAKILFIDLMDYFSKFQKQRLRITPELKPYVDNIEIISTPDFYKTGYLDTKIFTRQSYDTVIFFGLDHFRQIQKLGLHKFKKLDLSKLITEINASKIYIVDQPISAIATSEIYHRRRVEARFSNLPITRIIWNLPTPPRHKKFKHPRFPHLRVILTCDSTSSTSELIEFQIFRNYSSKFAQTYRTNRTIIQTAKIMAKPKKQKHLIEKSKNLIFNFDKYYSGNETIDKSNTQVSLKILITEEIHFSGHHDLLTYSEISPSNSRSTQYHKNVINHKYSKKDPYQLKSEKRKVTFLPPDPNTLLPNYNKEMAIQVELQQIMDTVELIKSQPLEFADSQFEELIQQISELTSNLAIPEEETNDQIIQVLLQWDYNQLNLLEIIRYQQNLFFKNYVRSDFLASRTNSDHKITLRYGKSLILLLIWLKLSFPELDEYHMRHLYRKYSPWILKIIGYQERRNDSISVFKVTSIWKQLLQYSKLAKKTGYIVSSTSLTNYLTDITHGIFIENGSYSWVIIEAQSNTDKIYDIGLFPFNLSQLLRPLSMNIFETSILDKSIILKEMKELAKLSSLSISQLASKKKTLLPFILANFRHQQHLWIIHENEIKSAGRIYLQINENKILSISKIGLFSSYLPDLEVQSESLPHSFSLNIILQELSTIQVEDLPRAALVKLWLNKHEAEIIADYLKADIDSEEIEDPPDEEILHSDYFVEFPRLIDHFKSLRNQDYYEINLEGGSFKITFSLFDIIYDDHTSFLRPYLTRNIPLSELKKKNIPMNADEIFDYVDTGIMKVYVEHINDWCVLKGISSKQIEKYSKKPSALMTQDEKKKANKLQIYQHEACWKLTLGNEEVETWLFDDRNDRGYTSTEIAEIFEQGEIYDAVDEKKYLLDFDFSIYNLQDRIIFQEDRLILYIFKQVTGKFHLVQLTPNSSKKVESYQAIKISPVQGTTSIALDYISTRSADFYYYPIYGDSNDCKTYENWKYYIYELLEGKAKEGIFDLMENQAELIKMLQPYKYEIEEHQTRTCETCIKYLGVRDQPVEINRFQICPDPLRLILYGRKILEDLVTDHSWAYLADNYEEFLCQLEDLIRDLVNQGKWGIEEHFGVEVIDELVDIADGLFDIIDNVEYNIEEESEFKSGDLESIKMTIQYIRKSLHKISILGSIELIEEYKVLDDYFEDYDSEVYALLLDFHYQCNEAVKSLRKGDRKESRVRLLNVYTDMPTFDWEKLLGIRLQFRKSIYHQKNKFVIQIVDLGTFYHYLGITFLLQSQQEEALEYFIQSYHHRESGHFLDKVDSLNNIGLTYSQIRNYSLALDSYENSTQLLYEHGMETDILIILRNVAIIYQKIGDYENAEKFATKALVSSMETKNNYEISESLEVVARICQITNQINSAIDNFEKCLDLRLLMDDFSKISYTLFMLTILYNIEGHVEKSKLNILKFEKYILKQKFPKSHNSSIKYLISKLDYLVTINSDTKHEVAFKLAGCLMNEILLSDVRTSAWLVLAKYRLTSFSHPVVDLNCLNYLKSFTTESKQLSLIQFMIKSITFLFEDRCTDDILKSSGHTVEKIISTQKFFNIDFMSKLVNSELKSHKFLLELD